LDKKSFRIDCLKKLKSIADDRVYISDKLVANSIDKIIKKHKPKSILFYLPMKIEVDLMSLLKKYRKKLKIFVPFIEGESFKMVQFRSPLRRNSFGILQPPYSQKRNRSIDMIVVPVIGIDKDYRRVGFGKGMYDRFYEKLQKKPIVVFVQRVECKCNQKITKYYDIQADYYITPKELKMIGKKYDNRGHNSGNWSHSRWCNSVF
jgi:5-formyltetrahydrofolate cyclo-ligase